jgi:two-component system cell cycle sensor histidine kinase/response regulator CckA
MSRFRALFVNLPVSRKLTVVLWLFVLIVIALLIFSYQIIGSLSALRAYVEGESLWSKAQKQAVHNLVRYASSHSETDFRAYEQALQTPLGDKKARLELEKPAPDLTIVYEGFIQGRNSPDDVKGMAVLFQRFHRQKYMADAIAIWAEGDSLIEQLQRFGDQLHREIASGSPDQARIIEIMQQIDLVNDQLTPLEDRFSYSLGSGARWAAALFSLATGWASAMSAILGIVFTFLMLRNIRQAEERYKHFVDTANDAILVWDAETGEILEANKKSTVLLGRPIREIIGNRAHDIFQATDQMAFWSMVDDTLTGTEIESKELQLRRTDDTSIAVEVNTSLTELDGRQIIQGIVRDITARKRLEEEVRQAQKMEVVGRLAGGIAHDFNNLLMVILTHVTKLRTKLPRLQILEHTDTIQMAAEKAATLTKQLLAFGRKQVLELEVVNLNELISGALPILETIPSNGVQLKMLLAPRPIPVKVDPGKIEQVVMNLVVNAYDAMPEGGLLTIRTSRVGRPTNTGNHPLFQSCAFIEVVDTGCGMNAETRSHIFEPFFTTKGPGKGTGLGLSTVYGIVKQSGGSIEVESEPGHGSTFAVYLPIADEDIPAPSAPNIRDSVTEGSETVLLAEDQLSIRKVIRELLESKGYQVLEAHDRQDALDIAERYPGRIDVLVTDIVMPQLRGTELARLISKSHPGAVVIFMSGYSEEALVETGLLGQNETLIQKPFDPEILATKIRELLDRAQHEIL